jgi:starch synthase
MRILHVSPEVVPFAKTGGLADVVGSLPGQLEKQGHEVTVMMPLYKKVKETAKDLMSTGTSISVPVGDAMRAGMVWKSVMPDSKVPAYFIQRDEYFHRDALYGTPEGDYWDNAERFIFFTRGALEAVKALGLQFDVIHVHDWQSALIPVYLKTLYRNDPLLKGVKSVLTVHNLAYQGLFWHWDMKLTGLDWALFNWKQLEFWGKLNLLKGGLVFADAITTVSKRYAQEIQTKEYGCGLEGVLKERAKDVHGIINGVDYNVWNPQVDRFIPAAFSAANISGKAKVKAQLQKKLGLPQTNAPMIGMITRLDTQKGIDLVAKAFPELMKKDVQIVVLGTGTEDYNKMFTALGVKHKDKTSMNVKFDNQLAHEIEAGSDMFLMPSKYEPCGLNQIYSLKYGTVPIVRETGGLADTITDATPENLKKGVATGFSFTEYTPEALMAVINRALDMYKDKAAWDRLMKTCMSQDWSWNRSAKEYVELYRKLRG